MCRPFGLLLLLLVIAADATKKADKQIRRQVRAAAARKLEDLLEQAELVKAAANGEVIDPLGYYRYKWTAPTDECGTEHNADYDGTRAWNWGLDKSQHVKDPAACCAKCRAHASCNSWVFCPDDRCFAPDVHKHQRGECWLKNQRDPASPSVNMRGAYTAKYRARHGHHHAPPMVQWISGTIRRTHPATNGTWSGRAVW